MDDQALDKDGIIKALDLEKHPEGGYYRRTYVADVTYDSSSRKTASAIYFLMEDGAPSFWHRTGADELWFWHAGAAMELEYAAVGAEPSSTILGVDLNAGQRPQYTIPGDLWQRAKSLGDWSLVSCTVTPEFLFDQFEMVKDPDWMP